MSDTIEERIHVTLQKKGLLFENIVDGLSETQIEDLISTDEWLEMLGVKTQVSQAEPALENQVVQQLEISEIRERLYRLSPSEFEHLVKEILRRFGYPSVKVTGRTNDGGIDVISTRNTSSGTVRAVAQCKRYRGTVGVEVARELMGVIAADKTIEKGYLVTTGEPSLECLRFCEKNDMITLLAGAQVANLVKQYGLTV
jgi:restriction system protein